MKPIPITIRNARPEDVEQAVPLIHASGPAAFDHVFEVPGRASALEFLRRAFIDGRGEFGHRNHVVAELDGQVVGTGAAWTGDVTLAFAAAAAAQILSTYGPLRGPGVVVRGLRVEGVIPPPRRGLWYVAHLGVRPEWRNRGVGAELVRHLLSEGRRRGCATAGLDVAVTNPRAQALYERLGFRVVLERQSTLSNAQGTVPGHRRMTLALD